jgi:hypothetical protein
MLLQYDAVFNFIFWLCSSSINNKNNCITTTQTTTVVEIMYITELLNSNGEINVIIIAVHN